MPRTRKYNRQMQLFGRPLGRTAGRPEHRAHLEESHVALPHAPVVFDTSNQAWQQPGSQMRLFRREGILDLDRIRRVGGSEREGAGLEQPAATRDQLFANASQRHLARCVWHGAWPVRPQLVWERIVAAQPRDLLDEIDLARDIGAPAGDLHRQPVVLGRGHEAHRREEPLGLLARHVHPEELADARVAQEDRAWLLRLRPEIERRLTDCAARDRDDEIDGPRHRVRNTEHVDAAREAIARLAGDDERAARAPNAGRLEVGRLEDDVGRARGDLRFGAPHHTGHDLGPLGVADRRHLGRELVRHLVQRDDRLARLGAPHDDRRSAQLGEVERMHRLIDFEQDVVRRVNDVVDGALADGLETRGEPGGAWLYFDATNDGYHIARRALRIFEADLHTIHLGGWAVWRFGGWRSVFRTAQPPNRRTADVRKLHRPPQAHRQLARHTAMTEQVGAIGRHIDDDLLISNRNGFEERRSRRSVGLQLEDPGVIDA